MSVEFRVTSDFQELAEIAEARNASPEWRGVLEIKPSINRIVKLRGRPPYKADVKDIFYDLINYSQIDISLAELTRRISLVTQLESTYYPIAENFALRAARITGRYERTPDFIDTAKELVTYAVWRLWRPERGEDFKTLNIITKAQLSRALYYHWFRSNFHQSFSNVTPKELDQAKPLNEFESNPGRTWPVARLRQAAQHLTLPSMVATLDTLDPIEKIASLTVMGYYPDGRGFSGIAKQVGVDRIRLGYALNRAIEVLKGSNDGSIPERSLREIVNELIRDGKYRYASGSPLLRKSARYVLLKARSLPGDLSESERKIVELAIERTGNTLLYSNDKEIGQQVGVDRNIVYRVTKRVASRLQQKDL